MNPDLALIKSFPFPTLRHIPLRRPIVLTWVQHFHPGTRSLLKVNRYSPYQLNLIFLGQSKVQGILRHHLSGLGRQVELGTELVDVEQDDDSVTCRLKKTREDGTVEEEVLKTDYMVGADGGRGLLDAWNLPVLS